MVVRTNSACSVLANDDVKWFLFDEQLWITKYENYAQIEKCIDRMVGSFNWLYDVNDTLLFEKKDGAFNTAIICLAGIVDPDDKDGICNFGSERTGTLILDEISTQDYEFPQKVVYSEVNDLLHAMPDNLGCQEFTTLYITEDFAFVILENQLAGWLLRNASKHIYYNDKKTTVDKTILSKYVYALKHWDNENDDIIDEIRLDISRWMEKQKED